MKKILFYKIWLTSLIIAIGGLNNAVVAQSSKNLKVGDIVQFTRFGFCKLDKKEKDKLMFWYTHD